MTNLARTFLGLAFLATLLANFPAQASELDKLLPGLKAGGHVLVFRHTATDDAQKDAFPFRFDDMKAQRQLSSAGKETARQIGLAFKKMGVPVGLNFASKLNRAIETAELITDSKPATKSELTDTSAGSASGMARPAGDNTKVGEAILVLVNTPPQPNTNTIIVTHKTNIADAFGKDWGNVDDGEVLVFKPAGSRPQFVGRIKSREWIDAAR